MSDAVHPPAIGVRPLLALAWPVVLARSTQAVVGLSDALMVSGLGRDALTATTTGAVNALTAVMLPLGTVFIVQSFVAQLVGKGQAGETRRYAWYGLGLALAAGLLALLALPLVRPMLGLFDYDPAVERLMGDYLVIRLSSTAAIVGVEALGNWFGGHGNTRVQMWAGVITMIANLAGNWLLIGGHAGAPAMGVAGAALASAIASWIGLAFVLAIFLRGGGGTPKATSRVQWRWSELRRVLRFGLPNGANWFLEFGAFSVVINVVVAALGTVTLGALNVVIQVNSVAFMPAFGVATAGAILAGQAIGAGAHDRVWSILRLTLTTTAVWMAAVGLVYTLIPAVVMRRFVDPAEADPDALVRIGAPMLALSAAWQLFDATALTLSETLRAAGDTAWCLKARVVLAWFVFVPAGTLVVFVFDGGSLAVIGCLIGYLALLACAMAWRYRSGAWRSIDLTGKEPELL
jgi:MATE family multidrug resistance protein